MSTLDYQGRYLVKDWPQIAVWIDGHVRRPDEDGDWHEDPDWVRVVMVGDNARHTVEVSELIPIDPATVCSCGQIGCWDTQNAD